MPITGTKRCYPVLDARARVGKPGCVGKIEWRLQVCMATAGVRFASDLHRRLVELLGADDAPSEAQVSRLVRTPPERVNLHTLAAFCTVLDCGVDDLLRYAPSPAVPSPAVGR